MRARLCSQDTFVPGERPAGQVRGRKADALGEVSAPVAWGLGNWTVAAGNGGPGGHRVGTANSVTPQFAPAPPSSPIRPRAEQPHSSPRCVEIRASAAAAGGPLRRCSAALDAARSPATQRRLPRLWPGRCPGALGPTNRPSRRRRTARAASRPPSAAQSGAACSAGRRGVPRLTPARHPGR